ncbi:hypothetical protein NTGBS_930003 [Candidatus Nitrotoga sp. BS]|nr:hypothetical protein NTGBS_930003 [Candidatus Nitrotoga sp. BS]
MHHRIDALIRRNLPKGTKFNYVSVAEINCIEKQLNNGLENV